jgi:hypothetical protein
VAEHEAGIAVQGGLVGEFLDAQTRAAIAGDEYVITAAGVISHGAGVAIKTCVDDCLTFVWFGDISRNEYVVAAAGFVADRDFDVAVDAIADFGGQELVLAFLLAGEKAGETGVAY